MAHAGSGARTLARPVGYSTVPGLARSGYGVHGRGGTGTVNPDQRTDERNELRTARMTQMMEKDEQRTRNAKP